MYSASLDEDDAVNCNASINRIYPSAVIINLVELVGMGLIDLLPVCVYSSTIILISRCHSYPF